MSTTRPREADSLTSKRADESTLRSEQGQKKVQLETEKEKESKTRKFTRHEMPIDLAKDEEMKRSTEAESEKMRSEGGGSSPGGSRQLSQSTGEIFSSDVSETSQRGIQSEILIKFAEGASADVSIPVIRVKSEEVKNATVGKVQSLILSHLRSSGVEISDGHEVAVYKIFPHFLEKKQKLETDVSELHYLIVHPEQGAFSFNIQVILPEGGQENVFVTSVNQNDTIAQLLVRLEAELKLDRKLYHLFFDNSGILSPGKTIHNLKLGPDAKIMCKKIEGEQ